MTWVMWNLISVSIDTVLVSLQDRFIVSTERTTSLKIILDTNDGTAR
jgi:hypothetical protein